MYEAKIIADSICNGHRLTTMQLTHPRIVHAEFNTHCMFARNASSSRAIPFSKMVEKVMNDPFIPVWWGKNQKGMQAAEQITDSEIKRAEIKWLYARDKAVEIARSLGEPECTHCKGIGTNPDLEKELGEKLRCGPCHGTGKGLNIHKQIVNRLLEPWMWITVCVTGDWGAWSNYFALRCHPDAQPEIQKQAYMAQLAYFQSTPQEVHVGGWHTPYVEDVCEIDKWLESKGGGFNDDAVIKISVGRCARTSYLTQEGKHDFEEDIKLHDRLRFHTPLHASPFEHVCQAMGEGVFGKYIGWKSYRHMLPREYVTDFVPNHPDLISKT